MLGLSHRDLSVDSTDGEERYWRRRHWMVIWLSLYTPKLADSCCYRIARSLVSSCYSLHTSNLVNLAMHCVPPTLVILAIVVGLNFEVWLFGSLLHTSKCGDLSFAYTFTSGSAESDYKIHSSNYVTMAIMQYIEVKKKKNSVNVFFEVWWTWLLLYTSEFGDLGYYPILRNLFFRAIIVYFEVWWLVLLSYTSKFDD